MFLASSADIKKLDNLAATKYGIPETQLMENAGKSIFERIKDTFHNEKFAIFCGKGNNGGDGFVVARLLKDDGRQVKIYLTHDKEEFSETARVAFDKLQKEIEILKVTDDVDEDAVIIDALLGISVSGAPRGNIKTAIDKITSTKNTVISIDIPSGLSADTGEAPGSVVKADYTYTLALDKIGLNTDTGKALYGHKEILDIGIPEEAVWELRVKIIRLTERDNEIFEQIVDWNYNWWGIRDGKSREEVEYLFKHSICKDRLPQTFVALMGDKAVGMYQISMTDDLFGRPDIYPWLINVYVDEKYRGRNICRELMLTVAENAKAAGCEELYLYTSHVGLYEKFGWEFVEYVKTFNEKSPMERLYKLEIK